MPLGDAAAKKLGRDLREHYKGRPNAGVAKLVDATDLKADKMPQKHI